MENEMKKQHYDFLIKKVSRFSKEVNQYRESLKNDPSVKNLEARVLWYFFYKARVNDVFSSKEFPYKNALILSTMSQIFSELGLNN